MAINLIGIVAMLSVQTLVARAQTPVEAPRKCLVEHMNDCFASADRGATFVMDHGAKTDDVALLLHGLNVTPYAMKDLAVTLYNQGMNVVAVSLSGHGTRPEDLFTVSADQWMADVDFGFEIARSLGTHVVLTGYSMGGALAVASASKYHARIKAMLLVVPTINPPNGTGAFCSRFVPNFWIDGRGQVEDVNPVRYKKTSTDALCQLSKVADLSQAMGALDLPVFTALVTPDKLIDFSNTLKTIRGYRNPQNMTLVFVEKASGVTCSDPQFAMDPRITCQIIDNPGVSHLSFPFKTNDNCQAVDAYYDDLEVNLVKFLGTIR